MRHLNLSHLLPKSHPFARHQAGNTIFLSFTNTKSYYLLRLIVSSYCFQSIHVQYQLLPMQLQFQLLLLTITQMLHILVKMGIAIQLEILLEAVTLMAH